MKAPPFFYHAPDDLASAVALLAQYENARVLAGGQSLMPMMNLRVAGPDHLIDLGRIADLRGVEETPQGLRIGAMVTQRALEKSDLVARVCPLLSEAVTHVGHQQTRNRGTLGGSLCHLDPGAELPVAAAALDAVLRVVGPAGARDIAFADFPLDYLTPSLAPGEVLTHVTFPRAGRGGGAAFLEFNRRPADFAIVCVALTLTLGADGSITQAAIAIGGVSHAPVRLSQVEAYLMGARADEAAFAGAAGLAALTPCDGDEVYPAEYRQELCGVLVRRALVIAAARAGALAHV
jgi:carbon-monoxide dehydrogenase medium subunit